MSTRTHADFAAAVASGVAGCYAFPGCAAISRSVPASSFLVFSTGAQMKLSFNYKHVESHKPVEGEVARHVGKLEKLLRSYSPDLIQLHGVFSKTPRTDENSCTLNLSLPSGTLHATGIGASVRTSCKKAFSDLEAQVKKHQAKLRKDYEWRRKRPLPSAEALS